MLLKSSVSFCRSNIFKLSLNMENIGTSDLAGFVEWKNEKILILACKLSLLEKPFLARCRQFRRGVILTKRCKWSFGYKIFSANTLVHDIWDVNCEFIFPSHEIHSVSNQSRRVVKGLCVTIWREKRVTRETGSSESSGNVTGLKFESRTPTLSRIRTPI